MTLTTGLKLLRSSSSVSLSDLLTLYRAVLRAQSIATVLSAFADNKNTNASLGNNATSGITQIRQDLERNVSKCDKFLALIEEVVDLQRIQETYGARNATSSGGNASSDAVTHDAYFNEHETEYFTPSSEMFRDKWVRVRPSFTPELTTLHRELQSIQASMHAEHQRVVDLCNELDKPPAKKARTSLAVATSTSLSASSSKVIMLEYTAIHGPHFRMTKRLSNNVLKILNSSVSASSKANKPTAGALFGGKSSASAGSKQEISVLSNQKAGTLFVTPQVFILFLCLFLSI